MARFPHHKHNVAELGKLLAKARLDRDFRKKLEADPQTELKKAGLPENVLHLMTFKIIDAANDKAVALPYKLNQQKLDQEDPDYLESISRNLGLAN